MTISAYHIYQTPGPRLSGWQCDAADGNDETIAEGYGKTPDGRVLAVLPSSYARGRYYPLAWTLIYSET